MKNKLTAWCTGALHATPVLRNLFLCSITLLPLGLTPQISGQTKDAKGPEQQLQQLTEAIGREEAQLAASQREILDLRRQMEALQQQMAQEHASESANVSVQPSNPAQSTSLTQTVEDLAERQAVQESEIATHDQTKVESESKYPVKLSGLILLSGFSNTGQVDTPVTPGFALPGSGSTGMSLRQTVLGVDARGPHLLGGRSSADLRVDFDGTGRAGTYNNAAGLLRLRTAHATLSWPNTSVFFALDHPLLSPNTPTSLTAIAQPPLAWSGNLWSWNPQAGVQHDLQMGSSLKLQMQAAITDVADPPAGVVTTARTSLTAPSTSERSRWPGIETHLAFINATDDSGISIGMGGYFSPHRTQEGSSFDAWAGALDYRLPLPARFQWSGSVYRGAGLGGLGAGAFKDYVYRTNSQEVDAQALNDVGGWTQLKQRLSERLEWNAAYGIDNAFAGQLRPFASTTYAPYQNLARNRTFFSNFILSPSTYLLFSFEYRFIQSSPVNSSTSSANIFGVAAAYKF